MTDAADRFSRDPCPRCGWRHEVNAFPVETLVMITTHDRPIPRMDPVRIFETGRVVSWAQYAGSMYLRVEFKDGARDNFYPCEVEHA
jgi:hypothetical protein